MRHTATLLRVLLIGLLLLLSAGVPGLVSAETSIYSWATNGPEGGRISALAIDPGTPDTLYAGTYGGVYKSTDGGGNWNAVNDGLYAERVYALTIDPDTPDTLYAGTDRGPHKSTDGGESWSAAYDGMSPILVNALAIDPDNAWVYYYMGNLYRIKGEEDKARIALEQARDYAGTDESLRSAIDDAAAALNQ